MFLKIPILAVMNKTNKTKSPTIAPPILMGLPAPPFDLYPK